MKTKEVLIAVKVPKDFEVIEKELLHIDGLLYSAYFDEWPARILPQPSASSEGEGELIRVEHEISLRWAETNPDLCNASFEQFISKFGAPTAIKYRPGFVTLTAAPEAVEPIANNSGAEFAAFIAGGLQDKTAGVEPAGEVAFIDPPEAATPENVAKIQAALAKFKAARNEPPAPQPEYDNRTRYNATAPVETREGVPADNALLRECMHVISNALGHTERDLVKRLKVRLATTAITRQEDLSNE